MLLALEVRKKFKNAHHMNDKLYGIERKGYVNILVYDYRKLHENRLIRSPTASINLLLKVKFNEFIISRVFNRKHSSSRIIF